MAFQLSPGVNVSEVDLTTVVPSVLTTAGAFVGTFQWGPANQVTLVDSEITLVNRFGVPNTNTATSFFTSANFLSYGNNLSVVRAVGSNCFNASANTNAVPTQILNESDYETTYLHNNNNNLLGPFAARYPSEMGNSLKVSVCANTSQFNSWNYKGYFTSAPGTSDFAASLNGSNDELHIIVIDEDGVFTGTKNTVLETYPFVSKAVDASVNGNSNYYKQVIFNQSKYIYVTDPVDYANTRGIWNTSASNTNFVGANTANYTYSLQGAFDDVPSLGAMEAGYDLFKNKDQIDISLVLTGDANTTLQQYVIDNIGNPDVLSDSRKDCVVFISPPKETVVNNAGHESADIVSWLSDLGRSSSYVVSDSGWKYQYDKYNNVYRWIPLNGDVAGLCVYTDTTRDPWFSPAGFNRGQIKNAIKLSWNPSKTYRDVIYAAGVNPVVSFPGQGIVLYGDKTLQNKPSAFDRINVRRLFITLERAIAQAAKFSLFELNDEFTRAQFVALITPFLRDVQGRRGITDFKVVCDTTNNTPAVIDGNRFVGDIYIKPARSINYIQLNFVAVGTGVDFTTVVGAF